jgi:hypothetical protein
MKVYRMKRRLQTTNEEKIADSIAGNWNKGDRSELLCERQDLKILPQQASSSFQFLRR